MSSQLLFRICAKEVTVTCEVTFTCTLFADEPNSLLERISEKLCHVN
jgi:hypothetical protein